MTLRPSDHEERMRRVAVALDGLSVGDAFGECFFRADESEARAAIAARRVPPAPWPFTDDTEMALAIAEVLREHGGIDRDALARAFARRYAARPNRGYGMVAQRILQQIGSGGVPWRAASSSAFGGQGSMGNGGAMRVAPVGAYFADDLDAAAEQARASAEVTHWHPEGQAGAVAVAVAAAWLAGGGGGKRRTGKAFLTAVGKRTPAGETRGGIERALALGPKASVDEAVHALGSGAAVLAADTVPFALWCAARHLDDYEAALWTAVAGLGDRDTTCAIAGGLVALAAGRDAIPAAWLAAREPLPIG